jgi:thioredoxin 1
MSTTGKKTEDKKTEDKKAEGKKKLVKEITDDTFQAEVIKSDVPVLVDFWAPWCGPCRAMAPVLNRLAEEYEGKVKIVKIDIDSESEIAEGYQIQSIPTFMLFAKGQMREEITGAVPKADLEKAIKRVLS